MNNKISNTGIRLGIFGGGSVTRLLYRPALAHARCQSVFDWKWVADPHSVDSIAGPERVVPSPYQDVLQQKDLCDSVDAVVVALPHHLHRDAVCSALAAGKHVLCEKPAALRLSELDQMEAAALRAGRVLAFCHFRRHLAAAKALYDIIDRQLWGACRSARWLEGGRYAWPAMSLNQLRRDCGGEVLYDIGAHVLDLLCWLFGPMQVASCRTDDRGGSAASFDVALQAGTIPLQVSLSRLRRYRSRVECDFELAKIVWYLDEPDQLHIMADNLPRREAALTFTGVTTVQEGFIEELLRFGQACGGTGAANVGVADARHYVEVFEQCDVRRNGQPQVEVMESHDFEAHPVVVTGASGFIGGHCVERLLRQGITPVSLAGRAMSCVRLLRDPVKPLLGDIADTGFLNASIPEGAVIFHCAAHIGGSQAMRRTIIDGTRALLDVAEKKRASAVVILGSMLAHGCPPDSGTVTERDQLVLAGDSYGEAKSGMWRMVADISSRMQTPVVVLEPTCVFGPWSESFVAYPVERMLAYKPMLLEGGAGRGNLIYIDHLLDAMWKAATQAASLRGQRFLLNEDENDASWKMYYSRFAEVLGVPCLSIQAPAHKGAENSPVSAIALLREAVRHYPPAARYVSNHSILRWKRRLLRQPIEVKLPRVRTVRAPERDTFFDHPVVRALYTTKAVYSSVAFRRATGWKLSQSRETCMDATLKWIKETWPDNVRGDGGA